MGNPQLILMDEPTSGMDALTKRLVWAQIQRKIYNPQQPHRKVSIILTSHSMEECEVLCSRLAIMVEGKFRCLGTPTHIKQKFGRGYTVSLLFKNETDMERGHIWVTKQGPFADHHENISLHNTTISFRVFSNISSAKPNMFNTPSVIFGHILGQKKALQIQDFSVKHTTLDEVFVGFAKSKEEVCMKKDINKIVGDEVPFEETPVKLSNKARTRWDKKSTPSSSSSVTKSRKTNSILQDTNENENLGYNKVTRIDSYI